MRITYIAAGAAGNYCGACMRDVALVRGLQAQGHDAQLLPLYTPLRVDGSDPSLKRVFYGGLNACLQQQFAIFRSAPRFVDWALDRPGLLRVASRFAIETRPEGLGDMTVSVLRGEDGLQRKELEKLVQFLGGGARPDVINLTNSLLVGLTPAIKRRLGVPVVCTLQGEESFIERLPEPHRRDALALAREHAQRIDMFLAPGEAYADEMSDFLGVTRHRIRVVRPGVDLSPYTISDARRQNLGAQRERRYRIGFLSRISPMKGLDILIDAFCNLERERRGGAMLAVAGQKSRSHREFWKKLVARLSYDGLADRLEYAGELDIAAKVQFLKSCSVFCLPSRTLERRGIACIEAMAAGTPVIISDSGVFREMLELTGGGLLVPPDDPRALADAIASLRDDPDEADSLGRAGAAGVAEHFSAETMVEKTLEIYREVLANQSPCLTH